ncbi:copper resistance CopC/CopD family protein [Ilumatobacter nonamiensis]|uniref:copper resistance CopC/CopD family protein n=1 Tax=Ilumatobacter nonamiensis TaxID=467093 RepID=UPI000344D409|nr:CopD family protein [Ilumatobacter nonamiensis]
MRLHLETAVERVRRHAAALLVIAIATMAGLSVSGGTVSAHTDFSGSTPSDGDVIDEPVELISLVFTGESEEAGDGFVVLDATGQVREPTSVSVGPGGKVFTLSFDPALAGGEIGVRWSVRAPDKHPIEGAFAFTVTAPATDAAAASTSANSSTPVSQSPADAPAATVAADDDMSNMSAAEMASMDEFLTVDTSRPGESQATLGRLLSFAGIALAIGGIAFAATTLRGERFEVVRLIQAVRIVGCVVAVGAAIQYAGVARIAGESLSSYWSSSQGFASVLRGLGGVAIAVGLAATLAPVQSERRARSLSSAVNTSNDTDVADQFWGALGAEPERRSGRRHIDDTRRERTTSAPARRDEAVALRDPGLTMARQQTLTVEVEPARAQGQLPRDPDLSIEASGDDPDRVDAVRQRWVPTRASAVAFAGCGFAVVSFWFDGHTVSKGWRPLHAIANSVHVVAGSVWMGGLVAMAVVIWQRHRRGAPPRALELVVRFSEVASIALGAVVVAGLVMAVSVLDSFGELTGTEWGQLLLLKSAAAVLAMCGGAYNHFRLIPALDNDPHDPSLHERMRSVVTAEAILLGFAVAVTAWLVAAAS